jgi:hypothetical protein
MTKGLLKYDVRTPRLFFGSFFLRLFAFHVGNISIFLSTSLPTEAWNSLFCSLSSLYKEDRVSGSDDSPKQYRAQYSIFKRIGEMINNRN